MTWIISWYEYEHMRMIRTWVSQRWKERQAQSSPMVGRIKSLKRENKRRSNGDSWGSQLIQLHKSERISLLDFIIAILSKFCNEKIKTKRGKNQNWVAAALSLYSCKYSRKMYFGGKKGYVLVTCLDSILMHFCFCVFAFVQFVFAFLFVSTFQEI